MNSVGFRMVLIGYWSMLNRIMKSKSFFLLLGLSLSLGNLSAKKPAEAVDSISSEQPLLKPAKQKPRQLAATKVGRFFKGLFGSGSKNEQAETKKTGNTQIDLSQFTKGQLDSAIKQALGQGLTNAISRLGRAGGFLTNQM
ncbi:MAG: hypothetical protein ACPGVU_25345 [Limisphaerales bacterium]